jgi:hypothetical protein
VANKYLLRPLHTKKGNESASNLEAWLSGLPLTTVDRLAIFVYDHLLPAVQCVQLLNLRRTNIESSKILSIHLLAMPSLTSKLFDVTKSIVVSDYASIHITEDM